MTHTEQPQTNPVTTDIPENPFNADDLKMFDEDDATAGRAIGKMLSLFFFYTVVVMALSGIWTWFVLAN